jgi:hypothetical protein
MQTEPAQQALRGDETHRAGQLERRDARAHQPCQGAWRVARMQRGEDAVPSLRGFDGDVGGLEVTDLADYQCVRVLPQQGTRHRGEAEAGPFVDIDLVDARQMHLSRFFGAGDVHAGLVEPR